VSIEHDPNEKNQKRNGCTGTGVQLCVVASRRHIDSTQVGRIARWLARSKRLEQQVLHGDGHGVAPNGQAQEIDELRYEAQLAGKAANGVLKLQSIARLHGLTLGEAEQLRQFVDARHSVGSQ
jgi:hypothetical protein